MRFLNWLATLFSAPTPTASPVPPPPQPPQPQTPKPTPSVGEWADELLALHNGARVVREAGLLIINQRLTVAAQLYAQWCADNNTLPALHTGPGGNRMGDRIKDQGYAYSRAGENIAAGQRTPDEVFTAWMKSTGHYQNIVNEYFTTVGFGRAVAANGKVYWCVDFATPLHPTMPLGLALVWSPPGLDTDAQPDE